MQLTENQKQQMRDHLFLSNGKGWMFDSSIFGTSIAVSLIHYFTNGRRFLDSVAVFGTGALCGMTKYTLMEHNYVDNNGTQPMLGNVFKSTLIGSLSVWFAAYMVNHCKFIDNPLSAEEYKEVVLYFTYENEKFKTKHHIDSELKVINVSKYNNFIYKVEYEVDVFADKRSVGFEMIKLFGIESGSFLMATSKFNPFEGRYEKYINVNKIKAFMKKVGIDLLGRGIKHILFPPDPEELARELNNRTDNEDNDENNVSSDVKQDTANEADNNHDTTLEDANETADEPANDVPANDVPANDARVIDAPNEPLPLSSPNDETRSSIIVPNEPESKSENSGNFLHLPPLVRERQGIFIASGATAAAHWVGEYPYSTFMVGGGAIAGGGLTIARNMIMNGFWNEYARLTGDNVSFLDRYDTSMDNGVMLGSLSVFFMIGILPKLRRWIKISKKRKRKSNNSKFDIDFSYDDSPGGRRGGTPGGTPGN